jgi:pyruvate/2-oxoglutarate dehydrogenase complex dihydrolipoamide dehydrogenase (E3) component
VVAGVEDRLIGGECPYWGCIPSKMMIRAGNLVMEGNRVNGMAGTARVDPDWAPVARRIRDEATDNWTTRWPRTGSLATGGSWSAAAGGSAGPARSP